MKKIIDKKEQQGIETTNTIPQNTRSSKMNTLIKVFTQTENSRQSTNLQSFPAKKTKDQKNNKNSDTRLKGSQADLSNLYFLK